MNYEYDIAIIGGGPGGYVAAIKAAQLGKKVCLIEKDKIGGTCLNVGCIPTKTLLKSGKILKDVKKSKEFGVCNIDLNNVSIDMTMVQKRKNDIVLQLVGGIEGLLFANKVDVLLGEGLLASRNEIMVDGKIITSENIIIATGSEPNMLPIPTDSEAKVMTNVEALNLDEIPESCVVIGGGVIGIEFAYFLNTIGTKVTVVEYMDRILPMVDKEISDMVSQHLIEQGVVLEVSAQAMEIKKNSLVYLKDGIAKEASFEKIIVSVGRKPSLEGIDTEKIGIQTYKNAILTDEKMKTNVDNIYAIGDVNGKSMLAHTASMEGIVAVHNICKIKDKMDYEKIPNAIYIDPEVASVGLTEEEAKEKYKSVKVGKFPFFANGKAKVEGSEKGLIKIIVDKKTEEILGVHIFGTHSTDMISEAVVAMKLEATAEELVKCVHPHPTISEVFHEAFHTLEGGAIHFI